MRISIIACLAFVLFACATITNDSTGDQMLSLQVAGFVQMEGIT